MAITISTTPSSTSIACTWNVVSGVDTYRLRYKETTGSYEPDITGILSELYNITGLNPDTNYTIQVTALDSGGFIITGEIGETTENTDDAFTSSASTLFAGFNDEGYEEQSLLFLEYTDGTRLILFGEIQSDEPYKFAQNRKVTIYGGVSTEYVSKKRDIVIKINGISKDSYDVLEDKFFKEQRIKLQDDDDKAYSNLIITGDRLGLAKFYGYNGESLYEGTLKLEQV